jgi:hypothetical protein
MLSALESYIEMGGNFRSKTLERFLGRLTRVWSEPSSRGTDNPSSQQFEDFDNARGTHEAKEPGGSDSSTLRKMVREIREARPDGGDTIVQEVTGLDLRSTVNITSLPRGMLER